MKKHKKVSVFFTKITTHGLQLLLYWWSLDNVNLSWSSAPLGQGEPYLRTYLTETSSFNKLSSGISMKMTWKRIHCTFPGQQKLRRQSPEAEAEFDKILYFKAISYFMTMACSQTHRNRLWNEIIFIKVENVPF